MMSKTRKNQSLLTVLGLSEDSANCGNCQHFIQLYAKKAGLSKPIYTLLCGDLHLPQNEEPESL